MKRQPRSVTVTYGAVSTALVVVIATVALIVKPPSPPALAEFAPQAESTIEESAQDQSSRFGSGAGGACAAGQVGCEGIGTPPTTAPPVGGEDEDGIAGPDGPPTGTVRRCVGEPPRQIEDPQSPPCVNFWQGDNGGATSKGVTRDEIRVAVANQCCIPLEDYQSLAAFFNRRFEFYGRRITFVRVPTIAPEDERTDPAPRQRSVADAAAERSVFAFLGVGPRATSSMPLLTRLAQHRIVAALAASQYIKEAELRSLHPYAWHYELGLDQTSRDLVEMACRSLVGEKARYGGTGVRQLDRSFAVVVEKFATHRPPDPAEIRDGLRQCGATAQEFEVRRAGVDTTGDSWTPAQQQTFIADLKGRKFTTVIPVGMHVKSTASLMSAASSGDYEPEWLLPGGGDSFAHHEGTWSVNSPPPNQMAHLMALGGANKNLPTADRAAVWAYEEQGLDTDSTLLEAENKYHGLLMLASGIQAAGPQLTPETFARGLQSLRFPNPGAGAAPYFQASVGFTGDHTMVDDEALRWWSATAPAHYSPTTSVGGWCHVDQGARWRAGAWPRRQWPFFDPAHRCQ